jgi:hypothetical protein
MKKLTVKDSELNGPVTPGTGWLRAVVWITVFLLPAGALAQSAPLAEDDYTQQETEVYEQQQEVYQEQGGAPVEEDYNNNPYQQPVMSEAEQDQLEQAQKSLGLPDSRRPEFNSLFDAEERAIRSKEEMLQNQQNQEFGF